MSISRRMTAGALALAVALAVFAGMPAQAHAGSLTAGAAAKAPVKAETVEMHRMYNPYSGEHLYTADAAERDGLVKIGWNYEGVGWVAPTSSKTPVHRLYNPYSGDHHYTTSAKERDWLVTLGWRSEGVGWYSDDGKRVPLHRLFNPYAQTATHHYTTDTAERDYLATIGWNKEGVAWYGVQGAKPAQRSDSHVKSLKAALNLKEDYHAELDHGYKGPEYQKYIVLHDTEGMGSPEVTVGWWLLQGKGIAAHFVVGRDGSILQCVPMDRIAHHAGYGNIGHNAKFGITQDGRDDSMSVSPDPVYLPDHAMNSWSIGIELVHVGGGASYTEAQLNALDKLIAYIDAYYGFQSKIIDHKMWRLYNSDTSPEFAGYLKNYQTIRRHA